VLTSASRPLCLPVRPAAQRSTTFRESHYCPGSVGASLCAHRATTDAVEAPLCALLSLPRFLNTAKKRREGGARALATAAGREPVCSSNITLLRACAVACDTLAALALAARAPAHSMQPSFWAHIGRSPAARAPCWARSCGCRAPLRPRWAPIRAQSGGSATRASASQHAQRQYLPAPRALRLLLPTRCRFQHSRGDCAAAGACVQRALALAHTRAAKHVRARAAR
jgi:hypothetical protein